MEYFQLVFEENNTIPFHDAHFPVTAQSRKTEIHHAGNNILIKPLLIKANAIRRDYYLFKAFLCL